MHHTCTACKGVSETPKTCETEGCSLNGQDLKECDCTDNPHGATSEEHGSEAGE